MVTSQERILGLHQPDNHEWLLRAGLHSPAGLVLWCSIILPLLFFIFFQVKFSFSAVSFVFVSCSFSYLLFSVIFSFDILNIYFPFFNPQPTKINSIVSVHFSFSFLANSFLPLLDGYEKLHYLNCFLSPLYILYLPFLPYPTLSVL